MTNIANLLTEHMGIWTAAETEKKSGRGRASGNAGSVYGVKKLRELILELAVRGKLVPQNPNDEPASELLKRIQAEKAKLIAERKLKKEKPLEPIGEDEMPFELPDQWGYEKLGNLSYFITKGTTPTTLGFSYQAKGVKFVKVENINSGRVNLESIDQFISDEANEVLSRSKLIEGDVLFSIAGTIGKTCIVHAEDLPANTNQALAIIRGTKLAFEQKFLLNQLDSFVSNKTKDKARGGAMNNVSLTDLSELVVVVPPLAEQHRIVAKVDELMALCDQLEQQHSNAQEAHETLVSQLLSTLTQSQNAAEFNANWQRIYAHFDVLFTTEASIDALKQTLLQLAVMGKLVPQDPHDQSASELLKCIQAEKAKLVAEGKLKKEKLLVPISEDEKPFEMPKGWLFVRLRELATHLGDGLHGTPLYSDKGDYYFVNGNNLKDGKIVIKYETKRVDISEFEKYKKPLNDSSVLVSINGTLGAVGFYDGEPVVLGKSACYINLVQEKVSKYFIKLIIDAPSFMEYAIKNATGTTIKNLGLKAINDFPVALPPLAEQHRIVAKVDALMALCDQLKTRIQQANQQQRAIADALVVKALRPHKAEVIDLAEYRKSLTCYVINAQHSNPTFGRTQAEKVLAFSQNHIGSDIELQFSRRKAGPYSGWMEVFEAEAKEKSWISVRTKQLSDTKYKYEYGVNSTLTEQTIYFVNNCPAEQKQELDRLLKLFENLNTEQAEIIATLFCAWNDFLINGDVPTDDEIIREVRENWHPSKERFSPEQLTKWLNWLRENNIVPTGKGSKTIKIGHQQKLIN